MNELNEILARITLLSEVELKILLETTQNLQRQAKASDSELIQDTNAPEKNDDLLVRI